MSDELQRRLRNLQESFDLGDIDDQAFQRGLERLRSQYGIQES